MFLAIKKIYYKILHLLSSLCILSFICSLTFLYSYNLSLAGTKDTQESLLDNIDLFLITVEKGEQAHLMFGHSVIRIKDNSTNTDTVVNWGIFDFDDPNFLIKFLKGNLYYSVEAYSFRSQLISWKRMGRKVYQDKLNLSNHQKQLLLEKIKNNLKPENKYFIYSYFRKNCATYPRDYINDILQDSIRKKLMDSDHITPLSYRKDALTNLSLNPFVYMGVDLIFNSNTDKNISVWERMYKPSILREALLQETNPDLFNSPPLLIESQTLVEGSIPTAYPISGYTLFSIFFGMIIVLSYVLKSSTRIKAYTKMIGIYSIGIGCFSVFASIFFIFFWGFSYQSDCKHNVNLFLFWPLDIIYIYLGIKLLFSNEIKINKPISFYSLSHIISGIILLVLYLIGYIEQDISNVLLYTYPILIIFYCLTLKKDGSNVFKFKK